MRKIQFASDNFYHIYNRGVDKRKIFTNRRDFERFYISLCLFNNELYHPDVGLRYTSIGNVQKQVARQVRKPLVRILSFCLIPNHFHLLIEPIIENGVTKFMHRLLMGYAKYFNKKYDRTGPLYDGEFKAILIDKEAHFEHLLRYIHLNVLDGTAMRWREGVIPDWTEAEKRLDAHPWSSHHVYNGKEPLLSVVEKDMLGKIFPTPEEYHHFLRQWSMRSMGDIREVTQW